MRYSPHFLGLSTVHINFLWMKLMTMDGPKAHRSNSSGDMSYLITKTSSDPELNYSGTFLSSQ